MSLFIFRVYGCIEDVRRNSCMFQEKNQISVRSDVISVCVLSPFKLLHADFWVCPPAVFSDKTYLVSRTLFEEHKCWFVISKIKVSVYIQLSLLKLNCDSHFSFFPFQFAFKPPLGTNI